MADSYSFMSKSVCLIRRAELAERFACEIIRSCPDMVQDEAVVMERAFSLADSFMDWVDGPKVEREARS